MALKETSLTAELSLPLSLGAVGTRLYRVAASSVEAYSHSHATKLVIL